MSLPPNQFVEMYMKFWREGKTMTDLAKALGVTKQAVSSRGRYMRKQGVRLPTFKRYNIHKLNSIVEEAQNPDES